MELGHYGWSTNTKVFGQHTTFLSEPAPKTGTHGILNLGNAPFDGTSAGTFTGAATDGTFVAMNWPGGQGFEFTSFLDAQIEGVQVARIIGSGSRAGPSPPGAGLDFSSGTDYASLYTSYCLVGGPLIFSQLGQHYVECFGTTSPGQLPNALLSLVDVVGDEVPVQGTMVLNSGGLQLSTNIYFFPDTDAFYSNTNVAANIKVGFDGAVRLQTAPSGAAYDPITWQDVLVAGVDKNVTVAGQVRPGKLWGTEAMSAYRLFT